MSDKAKVIAPSDDVSTGGKPDAEEGKTMSSLAAATQHLYRAFILRDLMSFALPGALVFNSALSALFDPSDVLAYLRKCSELPGLLYLLYLAFFCISYAVGLAIQYFGVTIRLVNFHDPTMVAGGGARTRQSIELSLAHNCGFQRVASNDARQYWERLAVLKQMSANLAIAATIASVVVGVRSWLPSWSPGVVSALVVLIIMSLYLAHRDLRDRQSAWERLWFTLPVEREEATPSADASANQTPGRTTPDTGDSRVSVGLSEKPENAT